MHGGAVVVVVVGVGHGQRPGVGFVVAVGQRQRGGGHHDDGRQRAHGEPGPCPPAQPWDGVGVGGTAGQRRGTRPAVGTAAQHRAEHPAQGRIDAPVDRRLGPGGAQQHGRCLSAPVRAAPGGGEVQGGAEAGDVGCRRGGLSSGLFGSEEPRRAEDHAGAGQAVGGVGGGGHPEVGEVGAPLVVEEDVGGLDVAMDDAAPVGVGEGRQQPVGDGEDPVGRQGPALPHEVGEAASGEVGHDEDHVAAVVDDVEEGDDGLVLDRGEGVELALETGPGQLHLGRGAVEAEALERDEGAVGPASEIDHAHATPGQAPDDLVLHGTRLRGGPAHPGPPPGSIVVGDDRHPRSGRAGYRDRLRRRPDR